jgi:hypothetical protein
MRKTTRGKHKFYLHIDCLYLDASFFISHARFDYEDPLMTVFENLLLEIEDTQEEWYYETAIPK